MSRDDTLGIGDGEQGARRSVTIRLINLTGQDSPAWLGPALDIYVTAMEYPRGTEAHRAALWRDHIRRPGWRAIGAVATIAADEPPQSANRRRLPRPLAATDHDVLVGIAYGYHGGIDQWWNQQLRFGLRQVGRDAATIEQITADYFELTELHVHPTAQGRGIGRALLTRLLDGRPEHTVLLSTPEIAAENNRAWSLYRRMGFTDVLRDFTFTGDPRPFAFLGRSLPLGADSPTVDEATR